MLDLNELRAEFARQLLDDNGRFSFDRALYKVLLVAYEAGIKDATVRPAVYETEPNLQDLAA